ncbi:hypothetical protein [Paenibacillus sonchi]|uniref:hypothetical protein n=1 Tax=Paenibacillus sonchi TaxID=373687 RepID=UPI001E35A0F1|nr:hypothetical protein [Paenibacillus sonchi]MCE3200065.1 hypothetical protein [Paenibacillus sonchi]
MTNLLELDLRSNHLLEIPESLLEIKGLERLDLRWDHELNPPGWLHKLEANGCIVYL